MSSSGSSEAKVRKDRKGRPRVEARSVLDGMLWMQPLRRFRDIRHGTQALLAAFDVQTGGCSGRWWPSAAPIHYDGADARWARFNLRHGRRLRFVDTPKYASWMNQVEIWFSI